VSSSAVEAEPNENPLARCLELMDSDNDNQTSNEPDDGCCAKRFVQEEG
jgi:hypothetical protein